MDLSKLFTENYVVHNIYQNGRFLNMLLVGIIRFLSSPFKVGKQNLGSENGVNIILLPRLSPPDASTTTQQSFFVIK